MEVVVCDLPLGRLARYEAGEVPKERKKMGKHTAKEEEEKKKEEGEWYTYFGSSTAFLDSSVNLA